MFDEHARRLVESLPRLPGLTVFFVVPIRAASQKGRHPDGRGQGLLKVNKRRVSRNLRLCCRVSKVERRFSRSASVEPHPINSSRSRTRSDALATFEDRDTDDGRRQYSVWIKPATFTQTPTANALSHVHDLFAEWVNAHPTAHPPLLFHITDGIYTDQDPRPVAQAIQALSGYAAIQKPTGSARQKSTTPKGRKSGLTSTNGWQTMALG